MFKETFDCNLSTLILNSLYFYSLSIFAEVILMRGNDLCFCQEIRNIVSKLSSKT